MAPIIVAVLWSPGYEPESSSSSVPATIAGSWVNVPNAWGTKSAALTPAERTIAVPWRSPASAVRNTANWAW